MIESEHVQLEYEAMIVGDAVQAAVESLEAGLENSIVGFIVWIRTDDGLACGEARSTVSRAEFAAVAHEWSVRAMKLALDDGESLP